MKTYDKTRRPGETRYESGKRPNPSPNGREHPTLFHPDKHTRNMFLLCSRSSGSSRSRRRGRLYAIRRRCLLRNDRFPTAQAVSARENLEHPASFLFSRAVDAQGSKNGDGVGCDRQSERQEHEWIVGFAERRGDDGQEEDGEQEHEREEVG